MPAVDAGYGQYLKSPARFTTAFISGSAGTWGTKAVNSGIMSPIALKADADAEVVRQAQFLTGPIARDVHVVAGQQAALIGRLVTITNSKLGYEGGADVFVIGAVEDETADKTTLTVLRRV
jgi:hypothetical protein